MASKLTNYQCPSCGGPLHFGEESQRLQCDYCGNSFSIPEIQQLYQEQEPSPAQTGQTTASYETQTAPTDWDGESEGMRLYNCPSCGAELICEASMAAGSCPYCGNPTVIASQFQGKLRPDYILPFRVSKEEALSALKKYYKGKKLLPRRFSDQNHLEEIRGVYVPFWLYDGRAEGTLKYQGTKVHVSMAGDEEITVTEYYDVQRGGYVDFTFIPADGARKMPDDLMDSIEPYDYRDLKPFSTAYMPGFLADIYDVNAEECFSRAATRAEGTARTMLENTVSGYSALIPAGSDFRVRKKRTSYALLPVWMLSTRWNGKNFLFAMNGQTGKFIGDLPVSMGRYFLWLAGIAAPLTALLAWFFYH